VTPNAGPQYSLWSGPLWLAFLLGCAVSAAVSGRFSARLIADGAISFAFIPAFEVASLLVVCHTGSRRRVPFSEAIDRFFEAHKSWWVWIAILAVTLALVPPRASRPWVKPLILAAIVPAIWSGFAHARFFRETMQRRPLDAWRDVALQRFLGWGASGAYFYGLAAWREVLPQLFRGLGR
jgi:hypothetical protein